MIAPFDQRVAPIARTQEIVLIAAALDVLPHYDVRQLVMRKRKNREPHKPHR
jgi:hypothetical protein